jgi:hypothetical protein
MADDFIKTIVDSIPNSEQFTLEVEERFALKTESGIPDDVAFREAVIETLEKWKNS